MTLIDLFKEFYDIGYSHFKFYRCQVNNKTHVTRQDWIGQFKVYSSLLILKIQEAI